MSATVAGDSFTASIALAEGVNPITATATFGSDTASATIYVVLDTVAPAAPVPWLIYVGLQSGGQASVVGDLGSVEANGTVTISNARTGETVQSVADAGGSFSAVVAGQSGDALALWVTDRAGNVGPPATRVVPALAVAITQPSDGATIPGDRTDVRGTFQGDPNVGVVINGVTALIAGSSFLASNVPLTAGANVLTASVVNARGDSSTASVTVTSTAVPPLLELDATATSGLAPLAVTFSYRFQGGGSIQQLAMDFDGDGTDDLVTTNGSANMQTTYSIPGVYLVRLTLTDDQSATYTATIGIEVDDAASIDACARAVWVGVTAALAAQDKEAALTYLTEAAQAKYGPVFDALLPYLPTIVATFSPPQGVSIGERIAEYAVNREIDGRTRIFFVYVVRGDDGVWHVDAM